LSLAHLGNGICLAGTSGGGKILRSTDYGATWSDLGQQFSQTQIYSFAHLGNGICLAGTGTGGKVLRSTDYGATWTDLGTQFSQTEIYSLAYLGNGICLAGTGGGGKILRSTNLRLGSSDTMIGFLNGNLAMTRISSNVRSATEILSVYKQGMPENNDGYVVALWGVEDPFTEDSSGNDNDLEVVGDALFTEEFLKSAG
jgi:hypothetical protein